MRLCILRANWILQKAFLVIGIALVYLTSSEPTTTIPPSSSAVTLTVWTTPNSDWHNVLLKSLQDIVLRLQQDDLNFDPHMYIHDGNNACHDVNKACAQSCIYQGRYCYVPASNSDEEDPKYSSVRGFPMVLESARRMCVWQIARNASNPQLFWDYLDELQTSGCDAQLTTECLTNVYDTIGMDASGVDLCMFRGNSPNNNITDDIENKLLQQQIELQRQTPVTDIPQLFVNGQLLELSELTTTSIFQAVCEAYPKQATPSVCEMCLEQCPSSNVTPCLSDLACVNNIDGQGKNPQDAASLHDVNSGFARFSDLLATRNIFTYQMLDNCVDLKDPGPLVHAIQTDDDNAFVSGADACTQEEAGQFIKVSKIGFEQCAGFDFLEFAEHNARELGTSFFGCLKVFANQHDTGIAIEKCTGLVLDTGLGRSIGHFLEYNAIICPCIPQLQTSLPECVFQRGEAEKSLDGPAVKLSTCLLGEMCNKLEGLCQEEVADLHQCLPHPDDNDYSSNLSCEKIENDCKEQGALLFMSPAPLAGATFPNRCQQSATNGKELRNAHVIDRYNAYRRQCVVNDGGSVREFGSPDDADQGEPTESSDQSGFVSSARILAVALATACTMATLYAYRRRKPRYRYSEMQMNNLAAGDPHEPYQDNVEVEDLH